jgi:hypothetical protein
MALRAAGIVLTGGAATVTETTPKLLMVDAKLVRRAVLIEGLAPRLDVVVVPRFRRSGAHISISA